MERLDMHPLILSVQQALKRVIDPELGIDMVALGLLYGVTIHGEDDAVLAAMFIDGYELDEAQEIERVSSVTVNMTLTTPGCPLGGYFLERVAFEVATEFGLEPDDVEVRIQFDPPWTPDMMEEASKAELGLD